MKKQISTKVVVNTIFESAKSKLNIAIRLTEEASLATAWKFMQETKQDLCLLEVIFFREQEYAMEDIIKVIRTKLGYPISVDKIPQVSKEVYAEIIEIENYITKELKQQA